MKITQILEARRFTHKKPEWFETLEQEIRSLKQDDVFDFHLPDETEIGEVHSILTRFFGEPIKTTPDSKDRFGSTVWKTKNVFIEFVYGDGPTALHTERRITGGNAHHAHSPHGPTYAPPPR